MLEKVNTKTFETNVMYPEKTYDIPILILLLWHYDQCSVTLV